MSGYRVLLYQDHSVRAETVLRSQRPLFHPTLLKALKELGQMHEWCTTILAINLFDRSEPIEHVSIR